MVEEDLRECALLEVTALETNFGKLLGISQLLMVHSDKIHQRKIALETQCVQVQ